MGRKAAREAAMKLLYESLFLGTLDQNALDDMVNEMALSNKDIEYINDIYNGLQQHNDETNNIITQYGKGWRLDRISKIDLSILKLALYEIMYRDDIPVSVSINEAVELAKKYGSEKSGSFINGILGAFIKQRDGSGVPQDS